MVSPGADMSAEPGFVLAGVGNKSALCGLPGFLGCAGNGLEALRLVQSRQPFALVTDAVLPGCDAVWLLRALLRSQLCPLPCAIVVTPHFGLRTELAALGARRFLARPVLAEALRTALAALTPADRLTRALASPQAIRRSLWALGFSPLQKGTEYLTVAIGLASGDGLAESCVTSGLLLRVARICRATPAQVEDCMRRAIESAWAGGSAEAQYGVFGNTIDARRAKPTSGEMIARMAESVRCGLE